MAEEAFEHVSPANKLHNLGTLTYRNVWQDFDPEMADKAIRSAIQATFEGCDCKDIDKKALDKWTKSVTDSVLKYCSQENAKCKYAGKWMRWQQSTSNLLDLLLPRPATVTIIQKVGAGFMAQNKMHWDNNGVDEGGDAFVKVSWENPSLYVLVTLYAVKVMALYSNEQVRAMKAMNIVADFA